MSSARSIDEFRDGIPESGGEVVWWVPRENDKQIDQ
jgi:hypothetical protein